MGDPDQPTPRNPLLRQREQLRAAAATEQAKLDEMMVVAAAESVVTNSRHAELQELTRTTRRRVSATRGQLTRARRDGSAEKIAAAQIRLDAAEAEWDRVNEATLEEIQQVIRAKLDGLTEMNAQITASWDAQAAIIDTDNRPPGFSGRSA